MTDCFFATDIHGSTSRYKKLLDAIRDERPGAVFLGGDLLPTLRSLDGEGVVSDPADLADLYLARYERLIATVATNRS